MSMELENIFLYYLIRALQFVQLDIWQIFLTQLLNNMWMTGASAGYHLRVWLFHFFSEVSGVYDYIGKI